MSKKCNPSDLTIAGIGIELANTGKSSPDSKSSSMLYFDRSVTFAISIARIEHGIFRQDVCFINRDQDTLASYSPRGGSASTAIATEDYFVENALTGDRTHNFAGFSKHLLRLAAPTPKPPPGPGEEDDGILKNHQTDEDIKHIGEVIRATIKRSDLTIVVSSNKLVLHHFQTQFPELVEILYPTIRRKMAFPSIDAKREHFPPYTAEIAYKTNCLSALKPLKDEEVEAIKNAVDNDNWKFAIEELKSKSRTIGAVPIDFIQLFKAWNAGLDLEIEANDAGIDKEKLYEKTWTAIRELEKEEVYSKYMTGEGEGIKGITVMFAINSLLGSDFDPWKHGAHLQGKMLGALLGTRMLLCSKSPKEMILPGN